METERKIVVLIVEDEEHIRMVLEYNLKLDGYEVCLAANGSEGLAAAREKNPDLILLDWMLGDMDGIDVLSLLKKDETTRYTPVFMLTAKGMLQDVERAFNAGADDYITKPFDPARLGCIIRNKLERCVLGVEG